jgi:hypothetical protein
MKLMPMKLIRMALICIVTLGLASLGVPPVAAQTADGAAPQKSTRLPTVNVQSPRASATRKRATPGSGSGPARARTAGYEENDINAAKFGSKHWWTVQGWQSGGSSGAPR